jgi:molybdopterin/thiamine biosynthesis adenylyltransferase
MKQRTVLLLGLGAVNGRSLELLARLGVGRLIGVDPDVYSELSWVTQPALPADAEQPKAVVLGGQAHAINPGIEILTAVGFAQDVPLKILRQADVFLAAGDNLELPVWAGTFAAGLGKRLIQAAVHGETWTALVRAYDLSDPESPCPACALSDKDWLHLSSRVGCDPGTALAQGREPTRALPMICGTAAMLGVSEVLKGLLSRERQALRNEELVYCVLTHKLWRTALKRQPRCRCPHQRWSLVDVPEGPAETTLAQLAARLGADRERDHLQVRGELPWISGAVCAACGREHRTYQFARLGAEVGRCGCGQALAAAPLGMRSVIPAADLRACWDRPLSALGLGPGAALGLSTNEEWTYFLLAGDPTSY